MANVQRGVVKGPNQTDRGNHVNGTSPLSHGASFSDVPNNTNKTARVNGSFPQGKGHVAIPEPNQQHRFSVDSANATWSAPATSPGNGEIPVNPISGSAAGLKPSWMLRDSAKK